MPLLFNEYKPFRNFLRQFDVMSSLEAIWQYSVHISEDRPLPAQFIVGGPRARGPLSSYIHPWDLDTLAREVVLNATHVGTRSLRNWSDLAKAVNHLRRLDGIAFELGHNGQPDVTFELHRIAHRQFPWQVARGVNPMMRALKIFGSDTVEAITAEALDMSARQMFTLGIAVGGHFLKAPYLSLNQDYGVIGIPEAGMKSFFSRITSPLDELRASINRAQSYDQDWLYVWNPLEAKPLISFDPNHPDRVICPIPRHLLRRSSSGIFYDLVNSQDFPNRFGDSFQGYIGEVIRATIPSPPFIILEETPYLIKGQTLHGVDWIVSDTSGHLFIETKAKRLTIGARTHSDPAALEKDLRAMGKAIVQHYKNIRDALAGKTRWTDDGLPVYPLILTLEDWFLFSPKVEEMLTKHVLRLLSEEDIDPEVLNALPYTIASANEFELATQVIAQVGIKKVMGEKTKGQHRSWGLSAVISNNFKEQMQNVNWQLFGEDLQGIVSDAEKEIGKRNPR